MRGALGETHRLHPALQPGLHPADTVRKVMS